ncbi:MFS transporter [Streptomyces sp. NPDC020807]|uniref:MFS transporter n=1 Tax=Streptomyces sp. NPDC020807 TaxID=3155119 RepID=UPI0033F66D6F
MSATSPAPAPVRPPAPAPSYAAVLRHPHVLRVFGSALVGRLSNGIAPLSLLLSVKAGTGSYAAVGTVMAVWGLATVLLSPARAALVDRFGPRRALTPLAVGYGVLFAALAVTAARGPASVSVLAALAAAGGAVTPPLGPVTRARLSRLVTDRDLLRRAYSLDTVAEEFLFVSGPLLVGLLVGFAPPATGLAVCAGLVVAGTFALVSAPGMRDAEGARGAGTAETAEAAEAGAEAGAAARARTGVVRAVAVAAALGVCLGGFDLLLIAFAEEHRRPEIVPWAMSALSAGSAVGGLVLGAVDVRVPTALRLSLLTLGLGAVLATAGLSPHPYVLVGWVALGGLCLAPALTSAYLLADESAAPGRRTRAGAWVNTAFNAGTTAATAGAGLLVGRLPLAACFALAALPAVGAALVTLLPRASAGGADPRE